MNISKSINIALAQKELFRSDLAEGIGVTPMTISRIYTSGACKFGMLKKMAGFFNMTVSEFVALGEEKRRGVMSRESEQLPDCMMPDGAEPCNAYGKIRKELDDSRILAASRLSLLVLLKRDSDLLIQTCERLRKELDDVNGVIR